MARKLDFSSNSEEEANVAHPTGPSSSPCQSEDGSIGGATCSSLSLRGSTPNANNLTLISPAGKTRAIRGSATDPQSLYARVSAHIDYDVHAIYSCYSSEAKYIPTFTVRLNGLFIFICFRREGRR